MTDEGGVLSLVGGIRGHSVTNVTSDIGSLDELSSFGTDFEFSVEFGNEVFVGLGGFFEGDVFGIEISLPWGEVSLSDGDEVLGLFDLGIGGFELLGLVGNIGLESNDIVLLVSHILFESSLIGFLLSGEVGKGVFEVVLNVVHEITNLSDGITIGEFGGWEGNEGLDEGRLNGVLELLLDLVKGVLGLLNLNEGSFTSLELKENGEGFFEGGDGFSVFNGLLFEFGVFLLSNWGLLGNVISGIDDSLVKGGDIFFEVGLLDE